MIEVGIAASSTHLEIVAQMGITALEKATAAENYRSCFAWPGPFHYDARFAEEAAAWSVVVNSDFAQIEVEVFSFLRNSGPCFPFRQLI